MAITETLTIHAADLIDVMSDDTRNGESVVQRANKYYQGLGEFTAEEVARAYVTTIDEIVRAILGDAHYSLFGPHPWVSQCRFFKALDKIRAQRHETERQP